MHFGVLREFCQYRFQNRVRRSIVRTLDAIVHPLSLTPRTHDACISQIREMPRNLGLSLFEDFYEVADTDLPSHHEIKKP